MLTGYGRDDIQEFVDFEDTLLNVPSPKNVSDFPLHFIATFQVGDHLSMDFGHGNDKSWQFLPLINDYS